MNEISIIVILLVIGFSTGMLSGLFGIGGGIIFVPALFFLLPNLGVSENSIPIIAVATSLFAGSFSSGGSYLNHLRIQNINHKYALLLFAGSFISALIVPQLVQNFNPNLIRYFIIIALILVALKMFFENGKYKSTLLLNEKFLILFGIVIGAVSSVTGLGGGIFFVPVLAYLFDLKIKNAIGTSTLVVAMTMVTSAISYSTLQLDTIYSYNIGSINLLYGFPLGIGALIGSYVGVKIIVRLNHTVIKKIFSVLLVIIILKLIFN